MRRAHVGLLGAMLGLSALVVGCSQSATDRPPTFDANVSIDFGALADITPSSDRPAVIPVDAPNAGCAEAREVHDGDLLRAQAFPRTLSTLPTCDGRFAPNVFARWYRATVPARGALEVTLSDNRNRGITAIALSDCDAITCLPNDVETISGLGTLLFMNTQDASRTVLIAVTSQGLAGASTAVDVGVRIRPIAANATCATATPLVPGVVLRDQDFALTTGRNGYCSENPAMHREPALYYSITVPPRTTLIAESTRPADPLGSPAKVFVRPPCGETGCLAGAVDEVTRSTALARYDNASDAPKAASVVVICNGSDGRLSFDVGATLRPIGP